MTAMPLTCSNVSEAALAPKASITVTPFQPLDADILNASIPLFFIGRDTALMHRAMSANRKPMPQPTIISHHPSVVVSTRRAKSGIWAAAPWPKAAT
jgi:hypothetical protein